MRAAGQRQVVRAEDVAVMGITEILRHIPTILRSYRSLVRAIVRERPSAAVLIDFPDVNFRLAKHLKRLGIPVVWFVSPQLWAWKRRRLRWVQGRIDRMLVIFPFEERFYRARGVDAEFVGHPLAMLHALSEVTTNALSHQKTIALLPGSRWREIEANLPEMVRCAGLLSPRYTFELPVASTIDRDRLAVYLAGLIGKLSTRPQITLVNDASQALRRARASIVASGTATVLAAIAGNPFVVVYRVSPLTFALAQRLVRYPAEIPGEKDADGVLPVAMVNLIAGRRVVPELINQGFTAETLILAIAPLLESGSAREQQIVALREMVGTLRSGLIGQAFGSERVAEVVLELIDRRADAHVRSA